ncbi:MAG: hypothetical protein ACU85V_15520, partial [Gammaproteobacteria bacterium]
MDSLKSLLDSAMSRAAGEAPWLAERRRAAASAVAETGLPAVTEEAWKYTSLKSLAALPFRLAADADAAAVDARALEQLGPAGTAEA